MPDFPFKLRASNLSNSPIPANIKMMGDQYYQSLSSINIWKSAKYYSGSGFTSSAKSFINTCSWITAISSLVMLGFQMIPGRKAPANNNTTDNNTKNNTDNTTKDNTDNTSKKPDENNNPVDNNDKNKAKPDAAAANNNENPELKKANELNNQVLKEIGDINVELKEFKHAKKADKALEKADVIKELSDLQQIERDNSANIEKLNTVIKTSDTNIAAGEKQIIEAADIIQKGEAAIANLMKPENGGYEKNQEKIKKLEGAIAISKNAMTQAKSLVEKSKANKTQAETLLNQARTFDKELDKEIKQTQSAIETKTETEEAKENDKDKKSKTPKIHKPGHKDWPVDNVEIDPESQNVAQQI